MKVLFIGPYRQGDGWGDASRALIYSLLKTDIDLTIRPIFLAQGYRVVDTNLEALEQKNNEHYDVIIQHTLPELFHWYEGSKNIGFFLLETHNLQFTPWAAAISLMDEIWVSSNTEKLAITKMIYKDIPIRVIGEATNVSQFFKPYKYHNNKEFIFYSIGDGERKNFNALLLAFHREFDRNEPVSLLLKQNNLDIESQKQAINNLKQQWGLYKHIEQYKQETLVQNRLTEEELGELHFNCNCFVMPSYGEGWCRPALDALGFGKTPIVTDNTGMIDFINNSNGWVIPSRETPVITNVKPLQYLYNSRETWFDINVLELQRAMREAYTNKKLREQKASQGLKDIEKYSYESIGTNLANILKG